MKINLLLCLSILLFSKLQGMEQSIGEKNCDQFSGAVDYSMRRGGHYKDKFVIIYSKPVFNQQKSTEEMFEAAQRAIESCASKINVKNEKLDSPYILLFPNKEFDNDERIVKLNEYMVKQKEWVNACSYNISEIFTGEQDRKNCKLIVYNIPNNNISMAHHVQQIKGLCSHNVPCILNIASTIHDRTIVRALKEDGSISVRFGFKDKQPVVLLSKGELLAALFSGGTMFVIGGATAMFICVITGVFMMEKFLRYNK